MPYERTSGGVKSGVLEKIVKLTEEVVELQKENDRLQNEMVALSKRTLNVAIIAVIISIVLPTIFYFL